MQVLKSEVTGVIQTLEKQAGDSVEEGDEILIISSMKMEMPVVATAPGIIDEFFVSEDEAVKEGQELVSIKPR